MPASPAPYRPWPLWKAALGGLVLAIASMALNFGSESQALESMTPSGGFAYLIGRVGGPIVILIVIAAVRNLIARARSGRNNF